MTSLPRPTQKPRPKFYIAATQTPESFEFAGQKGYSLMAIPIGPIGPLHRLYRKSWRDAGHPGDGEVMVAFHMFCHEDARLAREIARPPFEEYFRALNEAVGDWARGTTSKDYRDYDKSMRRLRSFTLDGQIEAGGAWVGTPDEIKTIIRRVTRSMGKFEHASLQINFGNIDVREAQKSMRLFAAAGDARVCRAREALRGNRSRWRKGDSRSSARWVCSAKTPRGTARVLGSFPQKVRSTFWVRYAKIRRFSCRFALPNFAPCRCLTVSPP